MPSIWSYCDTSDRGFGLFKRRIFEQLRSLGWQTNLAEAELLGPDARGVLRDHWRAHPSDWVLLINQSGGQLIDYLELPAEELPASVCKWVWYLDDPRFFMDRAFLPNEYVFSFDETYIPYIQANQPAAAGFWPLGADMVRKGVVRDEYACDVSFVGGVIDQSSKRAQLGPEMQAYVDRLVTRKLAERENTFDELTELEPFAPGKQIRLTPQVSHYLYWEANNRYRLQVMEALSRFDLRIYGNEDWQTLLDGSPLLNHFHGPIDPVRELPDVFVSSRVNINIHSIQCRGSLNQRDFNAPMAGGFLLSDWVPAASRYFQPDQEAIFWSDLDDLCDKVEYWIIHPEERAAVVEQGRRRVVSQHTYEHRVRQIVETLRSRTRAG